jgi:hypothetical protein
MNKTREHLAKTEHLGGGKVRDRNVEGETKGATLSM